MAVFQEEYFESTEKMADAVMEYVAQFLAQDYLEEYKKAAENTAAGFVPTSFDSEMAGLLKRGTTVKPAGSFRKSAKRVLGKIGIVWICISSAAFIVMLAATPIRSAAVDFLKGLF